MEKGKSAIAKRLIEELQAQDQKALHTSDSAGAMLAVAMRNEMRTICPTPGAQTDLEKALSEGGLPLGFVIVEDAQGVYQLRKAPLPELAKNENALRLLEALGQQVADHFERQTGGYVERLKEGKR